MDKKACCLCVLTWLCMCLFFGVATFGQGDIADVPSKDLFAGEDKNKRYFLIGTDEQVPTRADGFGLVVVLPGDDKGLGVNPFVKRIYKKSLSKEYLVAQLVPVRWTAEQQVVWPTEKTTVEKQDFSTEEFIEAVIKDVKAKYRVNDSHIFTLSWSLGGPAGYAYSLQKEKSATGSFIAMSVFEPGSLPPLEHANGHAYFIFHSPTDGTCPVSMAEKAERVLKENGAKVKLQKYGGGHNWPRYPYGRITSGIWWLEKNHAEPGIEAGEPTKAAEERGESREESGEPEKALAELPPIVDPPPETDPLFWITKDGKIGYIDGTGKVVIKPQFDDFFPQGFSEGLARAVKGRKVGYIDKTGKMQFSLDEKFESASKFAEGMAAVGCVVGQELRYGYINMTGETVIKPAFTQANNFSEGLARVQVGGKAQGMIGGKYGYIDKSGKFVVECKFDWAEDFSDGLGCVKVGGSPGGLFAVVGGKVGGKFGYIDKEGDYVIEPQFSWARPFSNGLAVAIIGTKVGFIGRTGQFVIEPQFDSAHDFSEGLASVKVEEQSGYINRSGEYVIEPKFKGVARSFSEGLAAVYAGQHKFGFINRTGEFAIQPMFGLPLDFRNGLAWVSVETSSGVKHGYIDKTGKFVWGPE
jgi:predicted esterase